jgi:beta,beta-carotene 9',10'-dioxygenase
LPHAVGRVAAIFAPTLTDNCNVNVLPFGGETVAFTETTLPMRFAPDTLTTLGVFGYVPSLRGQVSIAHAHYDAARRRHYSYMVEFGLHRVYRLFAVTDDGGREVVAELPVDLPAYMHSFAMTERYLVLVEFPLVVSALALKFSGRPFIENYHWEPERGLRFHVVDKASGRVVKTAKADAAFAFHHVNAFEQEDGLVIDMIVYPDATIIEQLYLARLRAGKPYRYVWRTSIKVPGDFLDQIVKIDANTGSVASWYEQGCYPGEPVFVSAPSRAAADDGVLLSVVLETGKDRSSLLVLDAATLAELARAEAPHAIPFHFHGNYLPNRAAGDHRDLT